MGTRHTLGTNLRRIRKERGLSQEELGFAAEVNRSKVSEYERDKTSPMVTTVEKLAEALRVPLDQLFAGVGPQHSADEDVERLRRPKR